MKPNLSPVSLIALLSASLALMKKLRLLLLACVLAHEAHATSTINTTEAYSYGANIGWMNWRPNPADGVEIDEYVVSGYIYGANVGWINMGDGTPENNIQYSNDSATDYGVNYQIDPSLPGKAILRGYAYGANIGWISFENMGNPRIRFSDGRLEGYAWSANCGWINLGDGTFAVKADYVANGLDADSDGMADAFEFLFLGGLAGDPALDGDGDGVSNAQEYQGGTNPTLAGERLRIIEFNITAMDAMNTTTQLTWTSTVARLYAIDTTTNLLDPASWMDVGLDSGPNSVVPSAGTSSTRMVILPSDTKRYFRVRAVRPLAP